ncbi:MAG: hypothetical protein HYU56_00870 [Candidatus Aenigmarchaeota archaeon]|nr:hypothetical protein [Candidatus Aenigmarchaeota archaeon]
MPIAEGSTEAAYASPSRLVDGLVWAEKEGRVGLFARRPFAYLRKIDISDEDIVSGLEFYGLDTVIKAADSTYLAALNNKADPRQAFGYMLEAIDLIKKAGGSIPLTSGLGAVMDRVDQLYSDCFRI